MGQSTNTLVEAPRTKFDKWTTDVVLLRVLGKVRVQLGTALQDTS